MESKKRPLIDAEDSVVTKKRILTGTNGSPHVNGTSEEDDEEQGFREKLETYRKEAIYRRMQHYSRENERSQARIRDLEHRKSTCEAGLTAIAACWSQLVETIRLFVKTDDNPPVSIHAQEIFDLTSRIEEESLPELTSALSDTVNATQALVTKFVQLDDSNRSKIYDNEAFPECQLAQSECALLRSEVKLLRSKLKESESQRDKIHHQLISAENRIERSHSTIVRELESKGKTKEEEEMDDKEEVLEKPPSPAPLSASPMPVHHSNGIIDIPTEIQILVEQLKERDKRITALEKEALVLRQEKLVMEVEEKTPSYEQAQQNPYFKALLDHVMYYEAEERRTYDQIIRSQEDSVQCRQQLTDREEKFNKTVTEFEKTIADLTSKLIEKRDENARLRTTRNQLEAENRERKAIEGMRFSSLQELKALTESNSERIIALQSELKRCKSKLAANAGSQDLLDFFLAGGHDEAVYFQRLKEENTRLGDRVKALEQVFSSIDPEHPDLARHVKAEVDALEHLAKANEELVEYRRMFGGALEHPADVQQLAEELRLKDTEVQQLRLSAKELEENQSSIYTELDQLAAQWEALDKQVKSKVFNLQHLEDRLQKSYIEKAKAETKYYEAVKAHQAAEVERKLIHKDLEVESRLRTTAAEAAKKTNQLNNALEAENLALGKKSTSFYQALKSTEKKLADVEASLEAERKRLQELASAVRSRDAYFAELRIKTDRDKDELIRQRREVERQLERVKEADGHKSHSKPSLVEAELSNLRSLLQCTTCRGPPRSIIITKCMHTFCKPCIDTRLATRQRKCPACNIPFGASDVHQFFLQ